MKVWWTLLHGFCSKFRNLSSSESLKEFWRYVKFWPSYSYS